MLSRFSYLEASAEKKRVLYEGNSVIYEGMPLCYNYDTTDNVDGYDATDGAGTTTDEGHQNEGKYIRVEDVGNDGIMAFAGVVAGSNLEGVTGDGHQWLDIYIPNGATVPIRTGIASTRMQTLLAIKSGADSFENPVYGTRSATCAIAMETVDNDSADGLCLAMLFHPIMFNKGSQDHDYEAFKAGVGHDTGDLNVFKEYLQIWSTGGTFKTRMWETDVCADGCSCPYGGVISATLRLFAASDAQGGAVVNSYINTQFDSGSVIGAGVNVKNLYLRLFDDGATMTSADYLCNLYLENHIDSSSGANYQIYSYVHGSDDLDAFIYAPNNKSLGAIAASGDLTFTTDDILIPINIGGSTYYIVCTDNT